MYMGNTFYIDCSSDNLKETAMKLSDMLTLLGLKKRLSKVYSWPLASSNIRKRSFARTRSERKLQKMVRI
jgi:hypothetical protein